MLDAMPVPVWVAGADGARTMFNRAWTTFTGRTEAEELGWGWTEGVRREDLERYRGALREALAAGRPFRVEYGLRRFDGELRLVRDDAAPLGEEEGALGRYVGSCVDVTPVNGVRGASLAESTAAARALQHRLRNSYQLVLALLDAARSSAARRPAADLLEDVSGQVRTLALVDDTVDSLRARPGRSEEDGSRFVKAVAVALLQSAERPAGSGVSVGEVSGSFDVRAAVPAGLLLHELALGAWRDWRDRRDCRDDARRDVDLRLGMRREGRFLRLEVETVERGPAVPPGPWGEGGLGDLVRLLGAHRVASADGSRALLLPLPPPEGA